MKVIQLSMKDITYDSIYLGQIFCRLVTRSIKITWKALLFHVCPLMVNSYWVEGLPWKSSQEFRYQSYGTPRYAPPMEAETAAKFYKVGSPRAGSDTSRRSTSQRPNEPSDHPSVSLPALWAAPDPNPMHTECQMEWQNIMSDRHR